MRAVLFESGSHRRLVEMADPDVGDQDVLIRVGACGICASDLHLTEIKAGITDLPFPFVAGHEMAGTVVQVGAAVRTVRVGDRVVVYPGTNCGTCLPCRKGYSNLCQGGKGTGLHRPGGFADYVAVPEETVYACGDLPDIVAACTEPLACALHGLVRLDPRVADSVLIFGAGTIGLFFLQLVRQRGVGRISVVDLYKHRLDVAQELGADHTIVADSAQESALAQVAPLGFDCVVDATGVPAVVETTFRHTAPAGKLLMLGSCASAAHISLRPRMIQRFDVTVVGAYGINHEFSAALQLLQEGRIRVEPIVTHQYALDDFAEAFRQAASGKEGIKIQITPKMKE
jgi:2-desacetyl-2-hydroxyethyl bacteriochlorophyllide A dehydrogenase